MERVFNVLKADDTTETLGLGKKFGGIWVEKFTISMRDLSIKEIHIQEDGSEAYRYIMHKFNFYLRLVMPQYEEAYKTLYNAVSDPLKYHNTYTMKKQEVSPDGNKFGLAYDGGMLVKARITPIIMIFGNHEFNFIMKVLFHNITYNDGRDKLFTKNYEQKMIDMKLNADAGSMKIVMDLERIAMVTMDDDNCLRTGDEDEHNLVTKEGVFVEHRKTYAKLYLEGLRIGVLMHSNKNMEVDTSIVDLRACYLEKMDPNSPADNLEFFEKGFIGNLSITGTYRAESCQKLREEVVKKLSQESGYESNTITGNLDDANLLFENVNFKSDNLSLDTYIDMQHEGKMTVDLVLRKLKILAQTNVLLKLSKISQMADDVKPAEPVALEEEHFDKTRISVNSMTSQDIYNQIKESSRRSITTGVKTKKFSIDKDPKMVINIQLKRVMFVIPT